MEGGGRRGWSKGRGGWRVGVVEDGLREGAGGGWGYERMD